MTFEEFRHILDKCDFLDRTFRAGTMGDGYFLQVVYDEADVATGVMAVQRGRKWYVSKHATESEVVQTALKACITSHEHIVREHFKYEGQAIFGPHWDVRELLRAKRGAVEDARAPVAVREREY
jgi:hypothetical protein